MKRFTAIFLTAMLLLSTAACGKKQESAAASDPVPAPTGSTAAAADSSSQEKQQADGEDGQTTEQAGTGLTGTAAAETAEGAVEKSALLEDPEIPEVPYTRDDGGVSMDVFAMDTYMTILAYGTKEGGSEQAEEAVLAAAEEIHRLDDLLSTGKPESMISKLNESGIISAPPDIVQLVRTSKELYTETGGLFNIAIYPVMKLWGFPTQEYRVPSKTELAKALKLADVDAVKVVVQADAKADSPVVSSAAPAGANAKAQKTTAAAGTAAKTQKTAAPSGADAKTQKTSAAASTTAPAGTNAKAQKTAAPSGADAKTQKTSAAASTTGATTAAASETAAPSGADAKTQKTSAAASTTGATSAAASETAAPAGDAAVNSKASFEDSTAPRDIWVSFGTPGMQIDLGGIAKGYTSSRVMEIFREHGIEHGLVSLGGNVQALGTKTNGKPWRVAIQNPEDELKYLGVLDIADKCVITSGGYERFFEQDGVRYHHIINPRTGYPADSGVLSATIISNDGALADGLSTSLFIMGKEEAEKYWRAHPGKFDYILEDADGTLYVTEGAKELLTTESRTIVITRE